MEIVFFDPNEFLIGVRLEQGEYQTLDEIGTPTGETVNGAILSIGLLFITIHFTFGFNGKREE